MNRRAALVSLAALSLLGTAGCRKKPEPAAMPAASEETGMSQRRADSLAAADAARRRADSVAAASAAAAAAAGDAQRAQAELSQALSLRIYFDYDQDVLRDDARDILDAKAAIMVANPAVALVISGHTDERGTAEYNLALGQRRAAQVKRYLAGKGISDGRLDAQSLGDSQPASTGSDDSSYQQNRRAEFEVRNGGALVRPRE